MLLTHFVFEININQLSELAAVTSEVFLFQMTMAEHRQADLAMEADLSSVASSPAAPPSHSVGLDVNPLVMVGHSSSVGMAPAPPPSLQPNPSPVVMSVATGLPMAPKSATPPEPAQTFACDFAGCHAVSNLCCLEVLDKAA